MAKPQTVHRLELVGPARARRTAAQTRQVVDISLRTSERLLLSVEEAADRLGVGRTTMWALLRRGDVASVHVGRLRRVEPEALAQYIERIKGSDPPPAAWLQPLPQPHLPAGSTACGERGRSQVT